MRDLRTVNIESIETIVVEQVPSTLEINVGDFGFILNLDKPDIRKDEEAECLEIAMSVHFIVCYRGKREMPTPLTARIVLGYDYLDQPRSYSELKRVVQTLVEVIEQDFRNLIHKDWGEQLLEQVPMKRSFL